jgi:Protein of unknown function (DUF2510)
VVKARERDGGFAGPEELTARSGLPEATVDALRERLLFVAVERAADTHHDRPETAAPQDGKSLPPPAWYPDPQGDWGLRWWDGARWTDWTDQVTARTTPPAKDPSRELSLVFTIEVVLAFGAFFLAMLLGMGVANCGTSASCSDLAGAWVLLMVAHAALLAVCGVMFMVGARTKRVAFKWVAVLVLPIGTVTAWIPFAVTTYNATGA